MHRYRHTQQNNINTKISFDSPHHSHSQYIYMYVNVCVSYHEHNYACNIIAHNGNVHTKTLYIP